MSIPICINAPASKLSEGNQVILEEKVEEHVGEIENGATICDTDTILHNEKRALLVRTPCEDSTSLVVMSIHDCIDFFSMMPGDRNLRSKIENDIEEFANQSKILCVSEESFKGAASVIIAGKFQETKAELKDMACRVETVLDNQVFKNLRILFQPLAEITPLPFKAVYALGNSMFSFLSSPNGK